MAGPIQFERLTFGKDISIDGIGLHSGLPVRVDLHPGEAGIWFQWKDERFQAIPSNVVDTSRCTKLGSISTIEHMMSALAGCGITDGVVEVSAPELPGVDGSAKPFVDLIRAAGTTSLGGAVVDGPFARVFEKSDQGQIAIAQGDGWWRYTFETGDRWPGSQSYELQFGDTETYAAEVAPARTFCFEEELEMIQKAGLGKGLDETSALVLGKQGYLNTPRFDDEPPRHKLLDLIGDLYLSGVPVKLLDVVAVRTGHTANVNAAHKLIQHVTIE
ncbi:MAG: UDP-3-O-acyl-N-acetylglucosamine deacetylase [Fimbriimonadaceae bacterium]|nr:UDP-3-O-acyl-N-acetylglucosamine deacetylase [Fimbriimonadaceae bacterium]